MPSKRTGYAPWSLTREAGVQSATVEGTIEVPQNVQPTLSTGFVDEKGNWQGEKSSDNEFIGITKAVEIPNGEAVLFPDTNNYPTINCEGFTALQFALKSTATGNFAISTVMGPDSKPFLNLSPIDTGGAVRITDPNGTGFENIIDDGTETLGTANAWKFFTIAQTRVMGQNNLQIRVTNNTGGAVTLDFGFRRLVGL